MHQWRISLSVLMASLMLAVTVHGQTMDGFPLSMTPEERLAELGQFLAHLDTAKGPLPDCAPSMMRDWPGLPPTPEPTTLPPCKRAQERVEVFRQRHAQLCKDLKITGGRYGCP